MTTAAIERLREVIRRPLPGWDAQVKMAPDGGRDRQHIPHADPRIRKSAVLLLLHQDPVNLHVDAESRSLNSSSVKAQSLGTQDIQVLLTVRSSKLQHHGGQISLPGGGIDAGESVREAAMREACEEVGIRESQVEHLGEITPLYIPVSRNIVYPIVGVHHGDFNMRLQEEEVEEAFSVSLENLRQPESVQWREQRFKGQALRYPYWDVHHRVPLWGATAMILSELLNIYQYARKLND